MSDATVKMRFSGVADVRVEPLGVAWLSVKYSGLRMEKTVTLNGMDGLKGVQVVKGRCIAIAGPLRCEHGQPCVRLGVAALSHHHFSSLVGFPARAALSRCSSTTR